MVVLKKGMVLNFRNNNIFARTIQMGMGHYYSHSAWVRNIKGTKVYIQEALGSKTKRVTTTEYSVRDINQLFKENRLHVMDFRIQPDARFENYCKLLEGVPYDYYAIGELAIARLMALFGLNPERFLEWSIFGKAKMKLNPYFSSEKRVDCSEAIARGIAKLTHINVLEVLGVDKFEQVTPQLISVLYEKLKHMRRI